MTSAPTPPTTPQDLDSDFYNPHLSVSLNPHTHLFTYNFNSPPRLRGSPLPRRGLEPVSMVPKRLFATDDAGLSPFHRRPRLLVQRMAAVQLRETYNPYSKYRKDARMAEIEWRRYKELKREVERAVEEEVERAEVEKYVQVLRERGRRRRAEEKKDGRRVKALVGAVRARADKDVGDDRRGGGGGGGIVDDNGQADSDDIWLNEVGRE
ncbi:hypothetical protein DFP73DRAFT_596417 [Morchella snyderi]|nr:hypothetical protein DFP73DRAFT_596417 [Morchella snyderi]